MKTCCFSGHRDISRDEARAIEKRLESLIESLIDDDVLRFVCGGAIGFDMLAAETVLRFKKSDSRIKLVMVLPCEGQDKYWGTFSKRRYRAICSAADELCYVSREYTDGCMLRRNDAMLDLSDILLCFYRGGGGGTGYTVSRARRMGLSLVNLYDAKKANEQLSFI